MPGWHINYKGANLMDLIDQLRTLADRAAKSREHIKTEEATKMALIAPFLQALGYDIFDPTEVIPEFTADLGTKKGEKVDYAIRQGGKITIIIECKSLGTDLDNAHASQLYRYFSVVEARIAVLTNGVVYRFYTDLDEPNKLDAGPFLELNLLDLREPLVDEVKKLHKSSFDLEKLLSAASDLKYLGEIKRLVAEEMANPSDDLTKYFAKQVYTSNLTAAVREQFRDIVRRAFQQIVGERLTSRLKSALSEEVRQVDDAIRPEVEAPAAPQGKDGVVTTEDELEAFRIVRAILREVVDVQRVIHRDTKSYFSVLLDDNNRRPLVRIMFDTKQKYLGLINADKTVEKVAIDSIDDIYSHAERIRAAVKFYETPEA